MRSRGKSAPIVELLAVMAVLLPISACSWANPWKMWNGSASGDVASTDIETETKREMPQVRQAGDDRTIYSRNKTASGRSLGVSEESRAIEERLGVH
jgi:hypothetical protein